MPKSALLLRMMDTLRDNPGQTIGQMAAAMGRSERTVYRYLDEIASELHVPVYCRDGAYYISERSVKSRLDLAPKEVLAVRLGLTSGAMCKPGPLGESAVSAWRKIEDALTADDLKSVRSAVKRHSISGPVLDGGEADSGIMGLLAAAIERNRILSVTYRSQRSGEVKQLLVDPYALVFRRHNWYLIAFSHTHQKAIQLKAVRMIEATETGDGFEAPSDFSAEGFYAKSWEMWAGGEEQTVRVKFSPLCAPLMRETKRHPTQELTDTPDGGVILSVRVSGIEEIGFWILSYGSEAEVLDPPELKMAIKENALRMVELYSEGEVMESDFDSVLARES